MRAPNVVGGMIGKGIGSYLGGGAGGVVGGVIGGTSADDLLDIMNLGPWHEQIIYEDGNYPRNEGFFDDNQVKEEEEDIDLCCYESLATYDDALMREASKNVKRKLGPYNVITNNCQDFVDSVLEEYDRLQELQERQRRREQNQPDRRLMPQFGTYLTTPVY